MTDDQTKPEPTTPAALAPMTRDPLLDVYNGLANAGVHVNVTLVVNGTTITGNVISFHQYLESMVSGVTRAVKGMSNEAIDKLKAQVKDTSQQAAAGPLGTEYIHLSPLAVLTGAATVRYQNDSVDSAIRIRLADVSGWWLGGPNI